ncbi:hypothetical protein [Chengkuizengella sediminis]|uniref:hypothetical protein n=1 Tax=Chengkuizengella sediminis TaxID=1885917 RepID=UPI001F1088F8|nr:hypothetical protein [Chengkuizengella sediminis]
MKQEMNVNLLPRAASPSERLLCSSDFNPARISAGGEHTVEIRWNRSRRWIGGSGRK